VFTASALATYVAACFLFSVIPGPSVSVVVANALARGTKAGLLTILGTNLSVFSLVLVVAAGLQTVVALVASAFIVIKLAGAAYLVWIGWRMFMSRGHLDLTRRGEDLPLWRYVVRGALVSYSNPKTLLFLGAFLPQFIDPARPAFPQIVVLGLIVEAVATTTDTIYAVLAGQMRHLLTEGRVKAMNRVAGAILMIGGVWLALVRRN
jgi:threonine/homoserine/homoserine lactone efflux protein